MLPRELTLCPDGSGLCIAPVPELDVLRVNRSFHSADRVAVSSCLARGQQLKIGANITVSSASQTEVVGVTVLASPDGAEQTVIGLNGTHLVVDRRNVAS